VNFRVLVITEVEKAAESNSNSSGDPFSPDRFFRQVKRKAREN